MVHWELKGFACAALAAMALACGGGVTGAGAQNSKPLGSLVASVRLTARSGGPTITRVQIEVEPAAVFQALTLDSNTGDYVGTVNVPTGPQTITASAYAYTTLVGIGTATVNVTSRGTTSVTIKILDNSTSPPAQDHGPIILAVNASNSSPGVNEVIDLTVAATEADGDSISYQWADDCHGNFGSATSSTTTWWNGVAQACTITVTVMSKTNTDVGRIALVVSTVSAPLTVTGDFIPAPYITQTVLAAPGLACTVPRDIADASCRPAIPGGTVLTATISFDPMPADSGGNVVLTDGCGGGGGTRTGLDLPNGRATFTWTAPAITGSCLLTATASRETLSDAQKVAVAIQ